MGTDFNSDNVSRLKVGETTEDEVIQLIGVPGHRTRSADGTVTLTYMYSPGRVVHPFTVFDFNRAQKVGAGMKTLTVILDGNGKVKDFTESSSQ
jgi:outer membrane protein assembly factor BamE (lipoprotein component of BamABCDE complex)